MDGIRSRLTYANVVSTLCLFVLLGGSATAAALITGKSVKDGSLTGKDVKNSSIGTVDIKNGDLLAKDFKPGQLPAGPQGSQGPQGAQGPKGDKGDAGEQATKLFAAISTNGTLLHGRGVTASSRSSQGNFKVTFDRALDGCVATASYYNENPAIGFNVVNHFALGRTLNANELTVYIYNSSLNQGFDVPFSIIVFC